MRKKENNYAFIDSQNLNLGIRGQGWKLDYRKFRRYLKDKYRVIKAYLFIGYIAKNEKLYNLLQNSGYVLIFKPVVEQNGRTKGNVDAELVLQAMHELCQNNFDKAVIVSGDGDFHCLAQHLEKCDKLKAIVAPKKAGTSKLLRDNFGQYIDYLNGKNRKLGRK